MTMLITEELEVALSADPLLGLQVTGGSTSVRGAWELLRRRRHRAHDAGVRRGADLEGG